MEETRIIHVDSRYKIVIERAASSTKGIDGFKVEVNGDDLPTVETQARDLYQWAEAQTKTVSPIPDTKGALDTSKLVPNQDK